MHLTTACLLVPAVNESQSIRSTTNVSAVHSPLFQSSPLRHFVIFAANPSTSLLLPLLCSLIGHCPFFIWVFGTCTNIHDICPCCSLLGYLVPNYALPYLDRCTLILLICLGLLVANINESIPWLSLSFKYALTLAKARADILVKY